MVLIERAHPSLNEQVITERLKAVSDWYSLYQHDRMGLFRAVLGLQKQLDSGQLKLGRSPVVATLRQFDSREVLRYTRHDRRAAYARLFGFGYAPLSPLPNLAFRNLFSRFTQLIGDDRQPINPARARQAGLILRNNLFQASYGQIQVLRIDLLELLEVALHICASQSIRDGLKVNTPWEVIQQVSGEHHPQARHQMAVAGRAMLGWLARPDTLQQTGPIFADELRRQAIHAQTWLKAAENLQAVPQSRLLPRLQLIPPQ